MVEERYDEDELTALVHAENGANAALAEPCGPDDPMTPDGQNGLRAIEVGHRQFHDRSSGHVGKNGSVILVGPATRARGEITMPVEDGGRDGHQPEINVILRFHITSARLCEALAMPLV